MIELPKRIGNISDTDYLQEQINSMKHQLDNSVGGSATTIANLSVENLEVKGKIDMGKNTSISWLNIKDADDVATQESVNATKEAIKEAEEIAKRAQSTANTALGAIPTNYVPFTTDINNNHVISETFVANNLLIKGGLLEMDTSEGSYIEVKSGTKTMHIDSDGIWVDNIVGAYGEHDIAYLRGDEISVYHFAKGTDYGVFTPDHYSSMTPYKIVSDHIENSDGDDYAMLMDVATAEIALTANIVTGTAIFSRTSSLGAGVATDGYVNCSKSGYTPIGVVGAKPSEAGIDIRYSYINGTQVNFRCENVTSSSISSFNITFTVLYKQK